MTSRFPKPGTTTAFWTDCDGAYSGDAVVLATSRHKASVTEAEALETLKAAYGPHAEIYRTGTWNSVTRDDMNSGMAEEVDGPGSFAEAGTGAAWIKVAYPTKGTVRDH